MHKENSTRNNYNIAPLKDFALEDNRELITPKARVLRQMKKNPTQRDEEKPLIEEDNKEGGKIDFESFDDEDIYSDEEEQGYSPTQLLEYDKFYKEQFFKNEIFKFDPKMKDKEEDEIKQEDNNMNQEADNNQEEEEDQPNYQEVKVQPTVKPLPKFDLSKFQEIQTTPEAKELLSIMQRYFIIFYV